jgi:hypothetical protein
MDTLESFRNQLTEAIKNRNEKIAEEPAPAQV